MARRLWVVVAALALLQAAPITTAAASSPADTSCARQGVTRIDIARREPFAGGMPFGKTGPYEKLVGRAFV